MARGGYVRTMWPEPLLRRSLISLAFAVLTMTFLACGVGAAARPACADAVLDDWTKGTLGSGYSPECYEAAIDALPEDLRAYTTAADDITRAAISASRNASSRQLADLPAESDPSAFPTQVAALVGLLIVTGASGLAAALIRRRRRE
jgi:hypothetical protein